MLHLWEGGLHYLWAPIALLLLAIPHWPHELSVQWGHTRGAKLKVTVAMVMLAAAAATMPMATARLTLGVAARA